MTKPTHVLAATDGSDPSGRAVDLAAEIARGAGARMTIVTVEDELSSRQVRALARAEGDAGAALDAHAHGLLADAATRARSLGIPEVRTLVATGDPAEAILEAVRENVDLLVLGRRGRGRLSGLLLGSVSQKLVSLAPCAVVVVP